MASTSIPAATSSIVSDTPPAVTGPAAYQEFELDLKRALLDYLPPVLDNLQPAALTKEHVLSLPEAAQGVYMLLEGGVPMYIGKTDAKHGFRNRLLRHFWTLSARQNINLAEVQYKAVRILVFTTVNVEKAMIDHYLGSNEMSWQNSGFGSNDPGHRREGQKPSVFDKKYPVNIDMPLDFVAPGERTALELLIELKEGLPFDLRYEADPGVDGSHQHTTGHADQRENRLNVPTRGMTLRELLKVVIVPAMPDGWTATVFPGRVILYTESMTPA